MYKAGILVRSSNNLVNEHSRKENDKKRVEIAKKAIPRANANFKECDDAKRAPTKTCGQRHHTPGNRKKLLGVMYLVPGIVFPFGVLRETRAAGAVAVLRGRNVVVRTYCKQQASDGALRAAEHTPHAAELKTMLVKLFLSPEGRNKISCFFSCSPLRLHARKKYVKEPKRTRSSAFRFPG